MREMRRKNQQLSAKECASILHEGTSGVLAVAGDDNYPYAVPLSYVYCDSKLFFHCAKSGHKLDAIARNNKVSFCVIAEDSTKPLEYTTYFRDVIVFGKARVLEAEAECRAALILLAAKYTPEHEAERLEEVARQLPHVCMLELTIEHMSGKQAIELARKTP